MNPNPLILPPYELPRVRIGFKHHLDQLSGRDTGWVIHDQNRGALNQFCEWMAAGDYRKGPMLMGPVGTGKSTMIQAASNTMMEMHGFGMFAIEAIELASACCGKEGRAALATFADWTKYRILIVEDLMLEKNAPSFIKGDDGINTVADLVQLRNKYWERGFPMCMGFTHNATDAQMMLKYGERAISRMARMVFALSVGGENMRLTAPLPEGVPVSAKDIQPAPPTSHVENPGEDRTRTNGPKGATVLGAIADTVLGVQSEPPAPAVPSDMELHAFAGRVMQMTDSELDICRAEVVKSFPSDVAEPFLAIIDSESADRKEVESDAA